MDKTISQIAMEIGVSKQAVWQKIKKEPLSTKLKDSTKKIGNTLYVNTDGIELIKNSFFKINANNTSIDVNDHKENINDSSIQHKGNINNTSIDANDHKENINDSSIQHKGNINNTSIDANDHKENINDSSIQHKGNINNTSIDANNHKENINKKSTDEIIDILTMQLKIINQQNENLAKELSKEREHSRELADKLAEIAYTAQKLHGGDMVSRLSNNEIEINSEEKTKKRSGMFNGIFNRILKKGQNT